MFFKGLIATLSLIQKAQCSNEPNQSPCSSKMDTLNENPCSAGCGNGQIIASNTKGSMDDKALEIIRGRIYKLNIAINILQNIRGVEIDHEELGQLIAERNALKKIL
ncbi:hypothetical protein ENBRE01_0569 [Enteropsectra breve]|nr:hypothetical protein ENBRE01_0569 [Enteropsectra breve]